MSEPPKASFVTDSAGGAIRQAIKPLRSVKPLLSGCRKKRDSDIGDIGWVSGSPLSRP